MGQNNVEKREKYTNTSIFLPKMINFKTRLRRNCKIKCMCVCGGGGGGGEANESGVGERPYICTQIFGQNYVEIRH